MLRDKSDKIDNDIEVFSLANRFFRFFSDVAGSFRSYITLNLFNIGKFVFAVSPVKVV
jgi:hypothetical protein